MMVKKRVLFLVIILAGAVLFSLVYKPAYEYKGTLLDPPLVVPDFELTAQDGQPLRLSALSEDLVLVYFGYTFCPDVCPLTLVDIRDALAELAPADRARVQLIFITADPERDTPEVLARYLAAFDPNFIGLWGDPAALEGVMKHFGAYAEKEVVSDSAIGYLVNHTARLYLLNANREIRLSYPFGFEAEDLRHDLVYLLNQ